MSKESIRFWEENKSAIMLVVPEIHRRYFECTYHKPQWEVLNENGAWVDRDTRFTPGCQTEVVRLRATILGGDSYQYSNNRNFIEIYVFYDSYQMNDNDKRHWQNVLLPPDGEHHKESGEILKAFAYWVYVDHNGNKMRTKDPVGTVHGDNLGAASNFCVTRSPDLWEEMSRPSAVGFFIGDYAND